MNSSLEGIEIAGFRPAVEIPYCTIFPLPGPVPIENLITVNTGVPLATSPEVTEFIASQAKWKNFKDSHQTRPTDELPSRTGIIGAEYDEKTNSVRVRMGLNSSYRDFTERRGEDFRGEFGLKYAPLPTASGVMLVTGNGDKPYAKRTSEDYKGPVVVTMADGTTATGYGIHEANTQYANLTKHTKNGKFDLRTAAEAALGEMNLTPSQIEGLVVLGMVYNPWVGDWNVVVKGKVGQQTDELMARKNTGRLQVAYAPANYDVMHEITRQTVDASVASTHGYVFLDMAVAGGLSENDSIIAARQKILVARGKQYVSSNNTERTLFTGRDSVNWAGMTQTGRVDLSRTL